MTSIIRRPAPRNTPSAITGPIGNTGPIEKFRVRGSIALGDKTNLTLLVGGSGDNEVVRLRNFSRQRAGFEPLGAGVVIGARRIAELITLLESLRDVSAGRLA